MNEDLFLQYIETDRNCGKDRLDIAVSKGLHKAKNDRFSANKLFMLAAACVITFVMCFTVSIRPVKTAVESYYLNWNKSMSGNIKILDGYIVNITDSLQKHLGGNK